METYKVTVDEFKTIRWHNNKGMPHRLDGPAVEWADGAKAWYVDGKLHRLDGPAVEYADGSKEWWVECQRHCLGGPAIEYANGYKAWWVEGKRIMSEKEFNAYIKPKPTCEGKVIEVDGIKYKLTAI